jgi:hypothetical protein
VPARKEALIRVVLLLLAAAVAGVLDWRPWQGSQQQYPWVSFSSNVMKAAASVFVLLPTSWCLSQQQQQMV